MNELAVLIPQDIDFSILASLYRDVEITFVLGMIGSPAIAMWFFNKKAWKHFGWLPVLMQCFSRAAMDIGLVAGIAGSAIGVVAMTVTFSASSNVEAAVSIALITMLWGGIFVGLGYLLLNPSIPITVRISRRGLVFSLFLSLGSLWYMVDAAHSYAAMTFTEMFLPFGSDSLLPYLMILCLSFLCTRFNGKPWVVSFTDANLLATMGGLGMGIVLWFSSGGGYEEGRAAIYTCANTLVWGSLFYIITYIASLYLGTQQQGNYQTKTWHLSEGAVFFIFLLYAPVGATEWKRESKDQAVQEANNQAQQQEIDDLKAQIAILMKQAEKTKDS